MIAKKITTTFYQTNKNSLSKEENNLVDLAINLLRSAYAPYSGFLVGAAILLENGEIISGNNQENVAYPSGLCAERVAIYYAGAKFPNVKIKKIAINAAPCGYCRQFINEIKGGNIPKEFIPSVEKGFKMAMSNGVLAGFPLNTLKVRLYDGSYHDVDSDALSFELAAQIAFKSACKLATPKILEPIMKLSVITPEINMGDVIGDLNRRRGQVEGMDDKGGAKVVNAKVPLSEMFGYITDLRTITSGRATSTMEFFAFVEAPKNISEEVIKKIKGE